MTNQNRVKRDAAGLYVFADEFDDVVHGGAGLEDGGDAELLEGGDVLIGDDAADQHEHVVHLALVQQVHDAGDDRVVRAGKDGQADHVDVFLQGGVDDHLGSLAQAGIDDFHASVAQGAGDHFRAAIVAVEAGLGDEHADLLIGHRGLFNHR